MNICVLTSTFNQHFAELVDTLAIDWASLVQEKPQKRAPTAGSALKRFTPASVFARIGISRAFAGDTLLNKIKEKCQKQLEEEAKENAADGLYKSMYNITCCQLLCNFDHLLMKARLISEIDIQYINDIL